MPTGDKLNERLLAKLKTGDESKFQLQEIELDLKITKSEIKEF